jgi:hypothetical protein
MILYQQKLDADTLTTRVDISKISYKRRVAQLISISIAEAPGLVYEEVTAGL